MWSGLSYIIGRTAPAMPPDMENHFGVKSTPSYWKLAPNTVDIFLKSIHMLKWITFEPLPPIFNPTLLCDKTENPIDITLILRDGSSEQIYRMIKKKLP